MSEKTSKTKAVSPTKEPIPNPVIYLSPLFTTLVLGAFAAFLVIISVITQWVRLTYKMRPRGLIRMFDLNMEGNVPSTYSTLLLLFAAALLYGIGIAKRQESKSKAGSSEDIEKNYYRYWKALAIIFLFLAIDEAGSIHELTMEPLRDWFSLGGFFHFAWVVPAAILVSIFSVSYIPFLMHLPRRFAGLFVFSGAVYVSGALGMEMVGAKYFSTHQGLHDANYLAITTVEESLEMAGMTIFIYTLLSYMSNYVPQVSWCARARKQTSKKGSECSSGVNSDTPGQ